MLIETGAPHTPKLAASPLPGWRPHRLDNGDWGSIYLGDTSGLPSNKALNPGTIPSKARTAAALPEVRPVPPPLNIEFPTHPLNTEVPAMSFE